MIPERPETQKGSSSPWTRLTWAFVLVALTGCVVIGVLDRMSEPPVFSKTLLWKVFPQAGDFIRKDEPLKHFQVLDVGGEDIGAVLITDTVAPSVRGYLGEIGLAVGITADGRITSVTPVRHQETPYYMEMLNASGFYKALDGVELSQPFPDIDTVSGATVSSRAIIRDVRETASRGARSLFDITVPSSAKTRNGIWTDWKTLTLAITLVISLLAGFAGELKLLNQLVMVLNLAVIGFLLNTPLTLSALSRLLALDLPGCGNTLLILILLYVFFSVPLQGRSYCRLVCPFGTLQHLLGRLSPVQLKFSPATLAFLPGFRRLIVGLLLVLGVWTGWSGFTEVEPFFGLFSFRLTPIFWGMVIFVLVMSAFLGRFWCNTMCPTGTLLSMVSRAVRPRSGRVDETI